MEISRFSEKLNKVDGNVYVIEEEIHLVNGAYEAELQHDNINDATFAVFTGPKLTGERLETYTLSTPSLAPWKRIARVYADVPVVYMSYETDGDTVEADDINRAQAAIVTTQEDLNAEESRAMEAERILSDGLQAEIDRAWAEESRLDGRIDTEHGRAQEAEQALRDDLAAETQRAKASEDTIAADLIAERVRAVTAEDDLLAGIHQEAARAVSEETAIKNTISANKPNWDEAYDKRHDHDNKSILDIITQAVLDNLTAAYAHVSNKDNPHAITKSQVGLGNVENKSGATIRSEMTKGEVVAALGYTPPETTIGYNHPDSGVKAGTYRSVTVDAQGHVTAGSNPALTWGDLKGV